MIEMRITEMNAKSWHRLALVNVNRDNSYRVPVKIKGEKYRKHDT